MHSWKKCIKITEVKICKLKVQKNTKRGFGIFGHLAMEGVGNMHIGTLVGPCDVRDYACNSFTHNLC